MTMDAADQRHVVTTATEQAKHDHNGPGGDIRIKPFGQHLRMRRVSRAATANIYDEENDRAHVVRLQGADERQSDFIVSSLRRWINYATRQRMPAERTP